MAFKTAEKRRAYHRAYQAKLREKNPNLAAERSRQWRAKHPEYAKHLARAAQGLPKPTRPEAEWCECCGRLPENTMHLDHDHTTGAFRGWLCGPCNLGLGSLGDDVASIEKALAYLKRAQ